MRLLRIRIHPIKSLAGLDVKRAAFQAGGGLADDRRWTLVERGASEVSPQSAFITKREPASRFSMLTRTRIHYDDATTFSLEFDGQRSPLFRLPSDSQLLADWCSEQYQSQLRLEESSERGWTDVAIYLPAERFAEVTGPTLISRATLCYLGERLGLTEEELFLRLRTNLLVDDPQLPPFGEESLSEVKLGETRLAIGDPVKRCPVPARDTVAGEFDASFSQRFIEAKAECCGDDVERGQLYAASVYTRVLDSSPAPIVAEV